MISGHRAGGTIVATRLAGKEITPGGGAHHHVQFAGALHDGNGFAEEHVREVDAVHTEDLISGPQTSLTCHTALLGELHKDAWLPFGSLADAQTQFGARCHMQHHIDVTAGGVAGAASVAVGVVAAAAATFCARSWKGALRGSATYTGQLDHVPRETFIGLTEAILKF